MPGATPRQLILPCLLLLAFACDAGPPQQLAEIAHPSLEGVDADAREQILAARERIESFETDQAAKGDRARAFGELGRLYQGYGFNQAATSAYFNATIEAPEDFRWPYYLGVIESQAGNLGQARDSLERVLESAPEDVPTLLRLGQIALDEARYAEADERYTRASELEPGCAAAHFGIGLAALGADDPERAILAFEQTLDLDPKASQTHRPLAMAYRATDQTARAREELAWAGTAVPTCPDPLMAEVQALMRGASALFERATLANLEGRDRAALDLARQAVEADPAHAAARRLYGQLLTRAGSLEEAVEQLEAAAELEPGDRRTYMLLGRAHRASGELDDSAAALGRAIELDPHYSRARVELALSLIEDRRWGDARRVLDQGLELDPDDLDLRVQLARTMAAMGDLTESRDELQAVIAQNDRLATARFALGSLLLELDQPNEAQLHLEAALEAEASAETYALAHYQLARLAIDQGFEAMAAKHLTTANELDPSFVAAKMALGEVELAQGRTTQAARLFAQAAEMRPDLPQPRAGEALALLHSGRHLDARRTLEQANRLFPKDPGIAHLLARVLATAPAPRVRDGERALELASGLFADIKTLEYGETVAMALAELGRFDEAVDWQERLLTQAREGGQKVEADVLEALEARLDDYQRGRPARDAW